MDIHAATQPGPWRKWAFLMGVLTALFSLRVIGQAVQLWLPQPWLPPFAAWQGSTISYPMLLAMQFLILGVMAGTTWRAWNAIMSPSRRAMLWTGWLGGIYMAAAIARIAVGVGMQQAPHWFTAWISGVFHMVLAGFVLSVCRYHRVRTAAGEGSVP